MNKTRSFYKFYRKLKSLNRRSNEIYLKKDQENDYDKLINLWEKWRNIKNNESCLPGYVVKEEADLVRKLQYEFWEKNSTPFGERDPISFKNPLFLLFFPLLVLIIFIGDTGVFIRRNIKRLFKKT